VITEIISLVNKGYNHFSLGDSELNNNLDHAVAFCQALKDANLDIKWKALMRPAPCSEELIKLLQQTGIEQLYVCMMSDKREQEKNGYNLLDVKRIIELCKIYDLPITFNLLTGFPMEPQASIEDTIAFFKENRPQRVNIILYIRVYGRTRLTKIIEANPDLHRRLSRNLGEKEDFIEPVFYNQFDLDYIRELVNGDELFYLDF